MYPTELTLLEKQSMTAMCRVGRPISYCRFDIPQMGGFNLSPTIPPDKGIEYFGAGLERVRMPAAWNPSFITAIILFTLLQGECGIRILNVRREHNGQISCSIGYPTESQESTGKLKLVVARESLF